MLTIGKECHFSQTLQLFLLVFISLMVIFLMMTSWPLAQLLNLMQKKIADKSKYKVIPVLYIFF